MLATLYLRSCFVQKAEALRSDIISDWIQFIWIQIGSSVKFAVRAQFALAPCLAEKNLKFLTGNIPGSAEDSNT